MPALIVVITQDGDHGHAARSKQIDQTLGFLGQTEMREIAAERQHVRVLREFLENHLQAVV